MGIAGTIIPSVSPGGITVLQYRENVSLQCDVVTEYDLDELEFEWIFENNSISTFTYSSYDINSTLFIEYQKLSSVDKSGSYYCIARNVGENVIGKSNVVLVAFAPVITMNPANASVTANMKIYFNCTAVGFPIPRIEWYQVASTNNIRNLRNLIPYSRGSNNVQYSNNNEVLSSLVIDRVQHEDYGYYYCVASLNDSSIVTVTDCQECNGGNFEANNNTYNEISIAATLFGMYNDLVKHINFYGL